MTIVFILIVLLSTAVSGAPAQEPPAAAQPPRARRGAEFRDPLASLLIPGLGQFLRGSNGAGAAFLSTALTGYALYLTGDSEAASTDPIPRHASGQQALAGLVLASGAGELSAYDAFAAALPALRVEGKYRFIADHAPTATLFTAPFELKFLKRWTTWIDLAQTAVVAAMILGEREADGDYEPYTARDAGLITLLSMSAGAGEEAFFRGWLLPLLTENTGGKFWLANGLQAAIFGAGHLPDAEEFAIYIGLWAFYEGWLTRRNEWNVRESVFQHFWYDVIIGTASLLADERGTAVLRFPTIRF